MGDALRIEFGRFRTSLEAVSLHEGQGVTRQTGSCIPSEGSHRAVAVRKSTVSSGSGFRAAEAETSKNFEMQREVVFYGTPAR